MSLPYVLAVLVVAGCLLWAVNHFVPMTPRAQRLCNGVVVFALLVWFLTVIGALDFLSGIRVND